MNTALYRRFCDIAYQRAGIALNEGKEALVSARVAKRLRVLKLPDAAAYLEVLERDEGGAEIVSFLDVITTNFTSFYREPDHFEELTARLQEGYASGQRRFRIWCAAASSGEEPYTIGVTTLEAFKGRDVDVRVLATDISTQALRQARRGVYSERVVRPVDAQLRERYFDRIGPAGSAALPGEQPLFRVKPRLRELIVFNRLNLATPPFPMKGPLDVVFCRNVMIYFDNTVRQRLISAIERLLRPGGMLIVGHTEALTGVRSGLVQTRPSVYRRPEQPQQRDAGASQWRDG